MLEVICRVSANSLAQNSRLMLLDLVSSYRLDIAIDIRKSSYFRLGIGRNEDPAGEIHRATTDQTDSASITGWLWSVRGS